VVSRRVLAYISCFSMVVQPVLAQNAAQPPKEASKGTPNISFAASEKENYARILLKWAKNMPSPSRATLNGSLLTISLPIEVNGDIGALKASAPNYIIAAAIGSDKKTIRIALSQTVKIARSKDGEIEAIDLINPMVSPPPPFNKANADDETAHEPKAEVENHEPTGNLKLKNWPAPPNTKIFKVESANSGLFTRVSIIGKNIGPAQIGRIGDRMALTIPGIHTLDIASMRAHLPKLVKDAVRYNDKTHTSVVMDIEAGAQLRQGADADRVYVDIFPAGAKIEQAPPEAAHNTPENKEAQSHGEKVETPSQEHNEAAKNGALLPTTSDLKSPINSQEKKFEEPAPSGNVNVNTRESGGNYIVDFNFEKMAPSAVFRRGGNIFVLFATSANFKINGFKANGLANSITPVSGEGVKGVKISAPDGVFANPAAIGAKWQITLSKTAPNVARPIEVKAETAPDNNSRLKALVADAITTGNIMDDDVGDKLLVGLSLGPPSALSKSRTFLEAYLPETQQGLVAIPRADDLEIRPDIDGFVLARPNGLALSASGGAISPAGFNITSPSFVDFINWRLGPQNDYMKNLNALKLAAAKEMGEAAGGIKAQLDLARFYMAWDFAPEALGVIKSIKAANPDYLHSPDVIGLNGAALALLGRGREAIEILASPEVASDAAAHLWSALAANASGDAVEARRQFQMGQAALAAFSPDMQAKFKLAESEAAYNTQDFQGSAFFAQSAFDSATDAFTKEKAKLQKANADAKLGEIEKAKNSYTELENSTYREIAARAKFGKAMMIADDANGNIEEAIRMLDGLRYAWRGDDLEIEVLRNLGELYIKAGDIRSGLGTLADASTLRPELPAARALRDTLAREFKHLFLEGGADGMDSFQALALFYDFQKLTPMGPEGDQMARGLADRLVKLDLLPQAEEILQHQVDNRLQGFTRAQAASDLAAIYLLDKKPEKALEAIWNSRDTQLSNELNEYRQLIEAVAMADLKRNDHALELIEFAKGKDADKIRAEVYWRKGEFQSAANYAWSSLPPVAATLLPEQAGEVLRAAIAKALSGDKAAVNKLAASYGPAMGKTGFAEAFKVVTSNDVPNPAQLKSAIDSVQGSSPFGSLLKGLRSKVFAMTAPTVAETLQAVHGPTDANPGGKIVTNFDERLDELNQQIAKNLNQKEGQTNDAVAHNAPSPNEISHNAPTQKAPSHSEPSHAVNAVPKTSQKLASHNAENHAAPKPVIAKMSAKPQVAKPQAQRAIAAKPAAQSTPKASPKNNFQAPKDPPN
jgi:tetratricopeptide (TPR) repeat protein